MYKYYIALGSNLGETSKNIDTAIDKIKKQQQIKITKIAPYYFTNPLLPPNADESYYKIFCNTCIEIETTKEPLQLLQILQNIEIEMGRQKQHQHWSPRIIDIDILYCEENGKAVNISTKNLIIPHKELFNRAFVLDPLAQLNSTLKINGKSVIKTAKKHKNHQAVIMAIVNITDNSFSGDGVVNAIDVENKINKLVENAIPIVDIGCEATNKKARHLTYQEEIEKLKTANIFNIINKVKRKTYSTRFSIDTYHPETAEFCLKNGFDIINDVNGFKDERMWKIMQQFPQAECVIMHSLEPHASDKVVGGDKNVVNVLNTWTATIKQKASKYCILADRIILDYGIGFGKTSLQSLQILQQVNKIKSYNFRVLIGHSKKSFMSLFAKNENDKTLLQPQNRVFETLGLSVALQQKGVAILRVHDAIELQSITLTSLSV